MGLRYDYEGGKLEKKESEITAVLFVAFVDAVFHLVTFPLVWNAKLSIRTFEFIRIAFKIFLGMFFFWGGERFDN